jgi:hypothetical protein
VSIVFTDRQYRKSIDIASGDVRESGGAFSSAPLGDDIFRAATAESALSRGDQISLGQRVDTIHRKEQ